MTGTKRARHPQPLDVEPEGWQQRVRSASSIGLFLDFDGTVSPIAETPLLAEIDPEIREIIGQLAAREDVRVSIVSGRSIDDVRARAGVAGVVYAGNHGLEIESDTVCFREPHAENLRLELRALILQLELALSGTDGTLIEQKGLSASVHYRQVNEALHEWVRHTVQQTVWNDPDHFHAATAKWWWMSALQSIGTRVTPCNGYSIGFSRPALFRFTLETTQRTRMRFSCWPTESPFG